MVFFPPINFSYKHSCLYKIILAIECKKHNQHLVKHRYNLCKTFKGVLARKMYTITLFIHAYFDIYKAE